MHLSGVIMVPFQWYLLTTLSFTKNITLLTCNKHIDGNVFISSPFCTWDSPSSCNNVAEVTEVTEDVDSFLPVIFR